MKGPFRIPVMGDNSNETRTHIIRIGNGQCNLITSSVKNPSLSLSFSHSYWYNTSEQNESQSAPIVSSWSRCSSAVYVRSSLASLNHRMRCNAGDQTQLDVNRLVSHWESHSPPDISVVGTVGFSEDMIYKILVVLLNGRLINYRASRTAVLAR